MTEGSHMNLTRLSTLEPQWSSLIETIAAMLTLAPEYVVVQTFASTGEELGAYVQTLQEEDGALVLEAASDTFVPGIINPDALNTLRELGWEDPSEFGLPNYNIFLQPDEVRPGDVAAFLILTLRDVYGITPKNQFECAPQELFIQIVDGQFGVKPGLQFTPIDLSKLKKTD
jgi:hypothetical protein